MGRGKGGIGDFEVERMRGGFVERRAEPFISGRLNDCEEEEEEDDWDGFVHG